MSEIIIEADVTTPKQPKQRGIPFKPGVSGNPAGRPRGARSKFSDSFISDLHTLWERRGLEVLERVAQDDPSTLLRVCGALMPKDISLSVGLDPAGFANTFRTALELLGNPEPPMLTIKPRVSGKRVAGDRGR